MNIDVILDNCQIKSPNCSKLHLISELISTFFCFKLDELSLEIDTKVSIVLKTEYFQLLMILIFKKFSLR